LNNDPLKYNQKLVRTICDLANFLDANILCNDTKFLEDTLYYLVELQCLKSKELITEDK